MNSDDTQYRAFIEELHDLADFRLNYTLDNADSGLDWEDPDVKRIIEALAFFGARTQIAAIRNLEATRHRLFQQFFPFLQSPLSAMAMMQAKPTGQLTEVLTLPVNTEFGLQPERGGLAMFRTTKALRVLPMELIAVKQELLAGSGARLLLSFQANYPLNEQPETISLHINYLNDLGLSLKALYFLERSLQVAGVQFGMYDPEQTSTPCKFSIGMPPTTLESDEWRHPLEIERYYFHFPRQELYLELELPPAPRNWKQFTITLDCNEVWPRQIRLNRDLFQLFTVPLINTQQIMAQPIICDGTQERYTIRHPKAELGFSLQKVLGVYEVTEQGMLPFRAGILAGGNGSYEVEQGLLQENGGHLYRLVPHFPAAFEKPRTLVVEALWQQPWYDQRLQSTYTLQTFRRQMKGVQWELVDTAVPHAKNRQLDENTESVHLLTLMHKPCLSFQDARDILLALGRVSTGRFQQVFNNWTDLRLAEEHTAAAGERMVKHIYTLLFKRQLEENTELIDAFVHHVGRVFDLWLTEAQVETRWELQNELDSPALGEKR